jgi:uncharacterized protein (DUF1330 family)
MFNTKEDLSEIPGAERVSAYFVLQIQWRSEEAKREYVKGLSNMIEAHGGDFIIATSNFRVVEGEWRPGLFIVIKFPTMEHLSAWYDSAEYRPVREFRLDNSRSDAVIAEGD